MNILRYIQEQIGSYCDELYFEPMDHLLVERLKSYIGGELRQLMENGQIYDYSVKNPQFVVDEKTDRMMVQVDVAFQEHAGSPFVYTHVQLSNANPPISAATAPVNTGTNGNVPTNRGYNANGQGTISAGMISAGTITAPTANVTYNASTGMFHVNTMSLNAVNVGVTSTPTQAQTADLPPISWSCFDEHHRVIRMVLEPEGSISAHDAFRLTMMMNASAAAPYSFNPYLYVKKHSLERHFKFSQV